MVNVMRQYAKDDQMSAMGVVLISKSRQRVSLRAKDMNLCKDEYVIEEFSNEIYELFQCKEDLTGKDFFDILPDFAVKEVINMLEECCLEKDQRSLYLNPCRDSLDYQLQFTALPLFFCKSVKFLLTVTAPNKLLQKMTPREKEIILQVLEGNTNRCISANLSITEGTVKRTIYNAYQKLGISSRIDLFCKMLGK